MRRIAFVLFLMFTVFSCGKEDEASEEIPDEELRSLPVLTTKEVINITEATANSGGEITDDGNLEITAKGVCWSTSTRATIADDHSNDGVGTTQFDSNLSDLTPVTDYYIRAYATNSEGTAYGNEIQFSTLEDPGIYIGDICFYTQQEIDDFGAMGYYRIIGSLCIGAPVTPNVSVNSLAPLNSLITIDKNVTIQNNVNLVNFDGLENLTTIGRTLQISKSHAISDVDPFVGLLEVKSIKVIDNTMLANVDGFSNLTIIDGSIELQQNLALVNLDGFNNITEIKKNLWIDRIGVSAINMENLSSIGALAGSLEILNCSSLTTANFVGLTLSGANIKFEYNEVLTSVSFPNLSRMDHPATDNMVFVSNDALTDINFPRLINVGVFYFHRNHQMTSLIFNSLEIIEELDLRRNDNLIDIDFSSLMDAKNLNVRDNNSLLGFEMNQVQNLSVGSGIYNIHDNDSFAYLIMNNLPSLYLLSLKDNPSFTTLEVNSLETVNYLLEIRDLNGLTELNFPSLTTTEVFFDIWDNSNLQSITMNNLDTANRLAIRRNNSLTSISCNNLQSIPGSLILYNNGLLNLDGFSSLFWVGEDLSIQYNLSLTDLCGIRPLLIDPGYGLDGQYTVNNNAFNPSRNDIMDGNCSL